MPKRAPKKKTPAAIYARISRDAKGEGLGVERQEEDCRKLAKSLGWKIAAVYVDNDISAHSGKRRPQYEAMKKAVEAGQIEAILAYHPDRLHRRAAELEEFVEFIEEYKVEIQTVSQGEIDLSTPSGRMVARIVGATSQHEVDRMKERLQRSKLQMVRQGKYRGGPRPYGFEADGVTIREQEAQVIREATQAVLAQRSLAAIARELNGRGLTTSFGRQWTYAGLKDVLVRPRNAALSAHGSPHRKAVGDGPRRDFEIVGKTRYWPAIVDEDDWHALVAILTSPSRRRQNGNDTRWLGSGIYKCGLCGAALRPAPYDNKLKDGTKVRKHLYRCTASAHLTISTDRTDEFVRYLVAERVRDERIAKALQPTDKRLATDRRRRRVLVAKLGKFDRDYKDDLITAAERKAWKMEVEDEIEEVDSRLAKTMSGSHTAVVLSQHDPAEAFLSAPVDVQRAVLRAVLAVTINRAVPRGTGWSTERLELDWLV